MRQQHQMPTGLEGVAKVDVHWFGDSHALSIRGIIPGVSLNESFLCAFVRPLFTTIYR